MQRWLFPISDNTLQRQQRHDSFALVNEFRTRAYQCMHRRADALFQLADAITCTGTPVSDIARLSLEPEQERGHGGVYGGLNAGLINPDQLRQTLTDTPIPTICAPNGRQQIVLAVDVSNWLRPDAATSPHRAFCHTYARGRGRAYMIPGWPYVKPGA